MPRAELIDLPGINIQQPWAELLLSGQKTIETRIYPLPEKYINRAVAIIETPGPSGTFPRRIAGLIVFGQPFRYPSKAAFRKDEPLHMVSSGDQFDWGAAKGRAKWGWPVKAVLRKQIELPKSFRAGIVYAKRVSMPKSLVDALYTQQK